MTGFRLATALALLALFAAPLVAFTAAPDPHVIITDPAGSCTAVGLHFNFNADGTGGGTLCFTNSSGADYFNLEVIVENPYLGSPLTCGGDIFATCNIHAEDGFAVVDFFGTLAKGMVFNIELMGFAPHGLFHADANGLEPEPEPATLILLSSGLAASLLRRRRVRQ